MIFSRKIFFGKFKKIFIFLNEEINSYMNFLRKIFMGEFKKTLLILVFLRNIFLIQEDYS